MNILFVCNGNVARSQMAEALWNEFYGEGTAFSAGVNPNYELADQFKVVMGEWSVPIDGHRSKHINEFNLEDFDIVVTFSQDAFNYVVIDNKYNQHKHFDVPDPGWNGSIEEYKNVRKIIHSIVMVGLS